MWNWSNEQNKQHNVQTIIKSLSFSKLFIVLMQEALSIVYDKSYQLVIIWAS